MLRVFGIMRCRGRLGEASSKASAGNVAVLTGGKAEYGLRSADGGAGLKRGTMMSRSQE